MFSSLTNAIFGGSSSNPEPAHETHEVDLKTREAEHDWLLVDLPAEPEQSRPQQKQPSISGSSSELNDTDSCFSDPESNGSQHPSTPSSLSPLGRSHYSYRTQLVGSESWILTPPPCFIAKRNEVSQVEDSPFENFFIEHPSVYVGMSSMLSHELEICDSAGENSPRSASRSSSEADLEMVLVDAPRGSYHPAVQEPLHRVNHLTSRTELAAQIKTVKTAQRQQQLKMTRKLNKKSIERTNRARQFQATGKRQRQRNRYQFPSGALNTRNGQRRC